MTKNIFRTEQYTGTMESLEKLVSNLLLTFGSYNFDVESKELINVRDKIIYHPGDYYQYAIQEKFEVI